MAGYDLSPPQWIGSIVMSPQFEAEGFTVEANVSGGSEEAALLGAHTILGLMTTGRLHALRVAPEVNSFRDIETLKILHRGYTRFVVMDQPGERLDLTQAPLPSVAFGQ